MTAQVKQAETAGGEPAKGIPRHVAIIMDGNGRWAKRRLLPRHAGHKAGLTAAKNVIRYAGNAGVRVMTLFAFSSENWRRPEGEVSRLMELFLEALRSEIDELHENKVRLRFIGELGGFPGEIRENIRHAEERTAANDGMELVVAVGYGGRWDITQAARQVALRACRGELDAANLTTEEFAAHLATRDIPEPDLFIRTGGEVRISNFLLWDLAYTELYFTDILWPDFNDDAMRLALDWFRQRQRRFGKLDEAESGNA